MDFFKGVYTSAKTGVNNLVDDNSFSNEGVAIRDRERDLAKCNLITTQESIAKFDELKTKHSNDVAERERKKKQKEEDERKKKEDDTKKKLNEIEEKTQSNRPNPLKKRDLDGTIIDSSDPKGIV